MDGVMDGVTAGEMAITVTLGMEEITEDGT
jgi:hypothetical protein